MRLCKRHLMQSVAMLRYRLALEQSGWVMTPGTRSVISANTLAVVQTQAIEDLNGVQRNAATARGSYRYRRPPRSMAQVLISETLSKRHRFETPFWDTPTVRKGPQISKEMFTTTALGSLPFEQIASTEAGAPWHSPQANNYSAPVADLQLIHDARASGQLRRTSMASLNVMLDAKHRIVVKHRLRDDQQWTWCVPVRRYGDSCVIAWPAEYKELWAYPGVGYLELSTDAADVLFLSVFSWSERTIMARAYVGKSLLRQALESPASGSELNLACRPFISGEITSLQRLAALHASWTMSLSACVEPASRWKIEQGAAPAGSLFDTLFTMITASLDFTTDEQVFVILRQRLAANEETSQFCDETILFIDGAMALFDNPDMKKVFNSTNAAAMTVLAAQTFTDTYLNIFCEKVDAAQGIGTKTKPKKYAMPLLRVPDTFHTSHTDATVMLPQGPSVLREHHKTSWWAHTPPFPRTHASWGACGCAGAALSAVSKVA